MKKIYGAFLAILMLGCFVGCNNNPSDDSSSKDDSLFGEITYTKPILPESVGKDPFEGLTELVTDSNKKFLVNTELKTISSCDSEGNISTEYEYSYKNTDDGVILSVATLKKKIYEDLLPVEDIFNTWGKPGFYMEEFIKSVVTDDFDYYDEYYGSESWDESKWQERIDRLNSNYGTSFTKDNYNREKFDWIINQCMSSPIVKDLSLVASHMFLDPLSVIYNYKIDITNINGTQADFTYEGIYDESKKWYEQTSVWFYGDVWGSDGPLLSVHISNGIKDVKDPVVSIDDSSIKTFYYDENNIKQYKTYSYTKTGSGYDSVIYITIDGTVVEVKPHSTDMAG